MLKGYLMNNYSENKEHAITIPIEDTYLNGFLYIPEGANSLVLFVHGSGSSRFSARNQYVAHLLNTSLYATLLFDLLTPEEDKIDNYTREFRFDIQLLASRLIKATHWCQHELSANHFKIGYFGASTGGAAALVAAAQLPNQIQAIVSRGGRPDLAADYLVQVNAPTLLIVGGDDEVVIELNRAAMIKMSCIKELEIVPGATHLFEEPGKLDEVARLATAWFALYFDNKISK